HLICLDRTTTGDGIIAALQVLEALCLTGKSLAELVSGMAVFPQMMINVPVEPGFDVDASEKLRDAVTAAERALAGEGRVVLRASGTEPVVRVMVEGRNESVVAGFAEDLAGVVRNAAAASA
ncbi:MAG: phosphoglucosamine mutase, partial [Gammaproteobacteria bacterium]|nr:phosphoglucosamine mutase [Gammaproteobacteria bacterium]